MLSHMSVCFYTHVSFIRVRVRVRVCAPCTYKLEEHMSQCMLRVGFRLQTALHCRQHLAVQLQDVLNI